MDIDTQEKIDAVNRACDVLEDTLLKLQKAFGVKPDTSFVRDELRKKMRDIFGTDFFEKAA